MGTKRRVVVELYGELPLAIDEERIFCASQHIYTWSLEAGAVLYAEKGLSHFGTAFSAKLVSSGVYSGTSGNKVLFYGKEG